MTILQTNKNFFTTTQKTLFFWVFLKFSFSMFFMFCLFLFPTWKRQKQKVHIFFRKPFFWHLDKLPKNYFRTPTHYLCFLRYPKNTIKLGKNKQKKILDQVLTQPWTRFWLKKPQILDQVLTLQHIYICRRGTGLSTFWPFWKLIGCPPFCQNLIFTAGRSILKVNGLATWKLIGCPLLVAIFDPKRWTTH